MTPGTLFLGALIIIAIAYVARLVWRWAALFREAREEWPVRAHRFAGDERAFIKDYLSRHGPLGATMAVAAVVVSAAATPFALAGLAALWRAGWIAQGRPPMFSDTTLVWQFYMFFGIIAVWVLIAWGFARAFHVRRAAERRAALAVNHAE